MNKKIWHEEKYTEILKEVGEGRYQILYSDDPFASLLYGKLPESFGDRFTCACVTTSATCITATADFICEGFIIPKRSVVVAWRTFRYCEHNGTPHLNADDNIIFPDEKGNIWKVARNDAPDHVIQIASWAGLTNIVQAYHLPKEKQGSYDKYVENGASVPIKIGYREKDG